MYICICIYIYIYIIHIHTPVCICIFVRVCRRVLTHFCTNASIFVACRCHLVWSKTRAPPEALAPTSALFPAPLDTLGAPMAGETARQKKDEGIMGSFNSLMSWGK